MRDEVRTETYDDMVLIAQALELGDVPVFSAKSMVFMVKNGEHFYGELVKRLAFFTM